VALELRFDPEAEVDEWAKCEAGVMVRGAALLE